MKWLVQIKNGELDFATSFNEKRFKKFLKENEGKVLAIQNTDPKSTEQRNYYFAAIIPAIAKHHNSDDLELWHAILKQEFNGVAVKKKNGQITKVGMSTKKLNKHNFADYLNRITGWMYDNAIPVPDSELYKSYKIENSFIGDFGEEIE